MKTVRFYGLILLTSALSAVSSYAGSLTADQDDNMIRLQKKFEDGITPEETDLNLGSKWACTFYTAKVQDFSFQRYSLEFDSSPIEDAFSSDSSRYGLMTLILNPGSLVASCKAGDITCSQKLNVRLFSEKSKKTGVVEKKLIMEEILLSELPGYVDPSKAMALLRLSGYSVCSPSGETPAPAAAILAPLAPAPKSEVPPSPSESSSVLSAPVTLLAPAAPLAAPPAIVVTGAEENSGVSVPSPAAEEMEVSVPLPVQSVAASQETSQDAPPTQAEAEVYTPIAAAPVAAALPTPMHLDVAPAAPKGKLKLVRRKKAGPPSPSVIHFFDQDETEKEVESPESKVARTQKTHSPQPAIPAAAAVVNPAVVNQDMPSDEEGNLVGCSFAANVPCILAPPSIASPFVIASHTQAQSTQESLEGLRDEADLPAALADQIKAVIHQIEIETNLETTKLNRPERIEVLTRAVTAIEKIIPQLPAAQFKRTYSTFINAYWNLAAEYEDRFGLYFLKPEADPELELVSAEWSFKQLSSVIKYYKKVESMARTVNFLDSVARAKARIETIERWKMSYEQYDYLYAKIAQAEEIQNIPEQRQQALALYQSVFETLERNRIIQLTAPLLELRAYAQFGMAEIKLDILKEQDRPQSSLRKEIIDIYRGSKADFQYVDSLEGTSALSYKHAHMVTMIDEGLHSVNHNR
jgi:hypothetical protein